MADRDEAARLRREIARLENKHDGLPESALEARHAIETQVNELRERLEAIDPQPKHGCAIEVGQTACRADHDQGTTIENGDKIAIIIGEQGHLDAEGAFSMDWWFVFQPA